MNLTSYRRLLFALGDDAPLTDNYNKKRQLIPWINIVSSLIGNHLDRDIDLTTHTEYADTIEGRLEYPVRGYPITSITSVYSDPFGLYDGNEIEESNYYTGPNNASIVLDYDVTAAKKGIRFIYVGGMAVSGVQSTFVIENEGSEAFTAGVYAEGQTSGAMGYVISKSGTTIVIEVLYGIFEVGEQIKGKATWDGTATADQEADIASVTSRCLAESYPEIVSAAELEIRYMTDHKSDLENTSTAKGSTVRQDYQKDYNLLPEVRKMLEKYVRYTV